MGKKPAAKSAETAKAAPKKAVEKTEKGVSAASEETTSATAAHAKEKKHSKSHSTSLKREDQHCKVKSCKREYRAKGYCQAHYRKWRNGGFGVARYKTCNDGECRKPMGLGRHGYCEEHYQNYYVKGVAKVAAPAAEKPAKEEKEAASA